MPWMKASTVNDSIYPAGPLIWGWPADRRGIEIAFAVVGMLLVVAIAISTAARRF